MVLLVFGSQLAISVKTLRESLLSFSFTFFLPFPSFVVSTFSPAFLLIPLQWAHLCTPFNDLFLLFGVSFEGSDSSMFERFASLFLGFCLWKGEWCRSDRRYPYLWRSCFLPGAGESTFAAEIWAFSCYLPLGSRVSTLEKVLDREVVKKRWNSG